MVLQTAAHKRTENSHYIDVLDFWDDEYMEPGMDNPTQKQLKKKDYNPKCTIMVHGEPMKATFGM